LPITADVVALPGASQRPLGAYISALGGAGDGPAEFLVVPVEPGRPPPDGAGPSGGPGGAGAAGGAGLATVDPALDGLLPASLAEVSAAYQLTGRAGEAAQVLATIAGRPVTVLLLGVGDRSGPALRRAGAELGRRIAGGGTATAGVVSGGPQEAIQAFAEGILLGSYRFDLTSGQDGLGGLGERDERGAGSAQPGRPAPAGAPGLARLLLTGDQGGPAVLRRAATVAGAVALARDLANLPSLPKTPQWLAGEAARVSAGRGIDVRVWSEADLAEGGFGGILAVGSGSARPPRLVQLSYHPAGARSHIVLVGKGITFDSGGLSLKPNDGMKAMKTDMAGGAVVIAVLSALASLGVPHRVTGLIAAAENMPSGSAYRPGDVITQYGGTTVEVLNTDAEGRLVLADALAYAAGTLAPDRLIDIATLTGAARVALGTTHAALYATDDALAAALVEAGQSSGDRLWRMPLADDYAPALASGVADLSHVATNGAPAGSITAALFLREFSGGLPWAHLDIAGTGRSAENDGELSKGATGFGVRLLLSLLTQP
jgi:leucyl aminopeptidase